MEEVKRKVYVLEERMSAQEFCHAIAFILTIVSGHCGTLNAVVKGNTKENPFFDSNGQWLPAVYLENVRNVVVQVSS